MFETPEQVHNRVAPAMLRTMIESMREANAGPEDIVIVVESITVGALLYIESFFGADRRTSVEALAVMSQRIEERLAEDTAKRRSQTNG